MGVSMRKAKRLLLISSIEEKDNIPRRFYNYIESCLPLAYRRGLEVREAGGLAGQITKRDKRARDKKKSACSDTIDCAHRTIRRPNGFF